MNEEIYRPGLEGVVAGETAISTINTINSFFMVVPLAWSCRGGAGRLLNRFKFPERQINVLAEVQVGPPQMHPLPPCASFPPLLSSG